MSPSRRDHAAAQKADAAHDLTRDAGRIGAGRHKMAQRDKDGRTDADERVGPQARGMLAQLAFDANGDAEQQSRADIEGEVEVFHGE